MLRIAPSTINDQLSTPDIARYGLPGSRIPNSLLFREYCRQCTIAIRVPLHAVGKYNLCIMCHHNRLPAA